jgi:signal transduction histidine kinase
MMAMQNNNSKKTKVYLLSVIASLMFAITGFFAYTVYGMYCSLYSKTSASAYSVRQSSMVLMNGNNGLKFAYPVASGGIAGTPFYFIFVFVLMLSLGLIIFMFTYFYRLIETQDNTERTLRSLEKNILEIPSAIMHEIKGNINSVLINSKVLAEKLKNLETNKDGIVKTGSLIESETEKLSQTMNVMLKFISGSDICPEDVNLSELIGEACEFLKERLLSKDVNYSVSVDKNIAVKIDKDLMFHAFKNLILNAAESYEGKPGDVLIYSGYALNKTVVTVEDRGTGIQRHVLKKIFEPFFTTKKNGAGLGLALTKKIVDAHGFGIKIESDIGTGTKISIEMKDSQ